MPHCSILGCKSSSKDQNVSNGRYTYHRFPKTPVNKEQWINATGRQNWFPLKSSTICSSHFQDEDFIIKKSGNRYLTDSAVPTRNILQFQSGDSSIISTSNINTKRKRDGDGDMLEETNLPKVAKKLKGDSTPNNLSLRPSNACAPMQNKIKKIICNKDSVIKKQRLQIKRIQAQNRRLRKKVNNLEDILKSVNDKYNFRTEEINTLKNTNVKVEALMARYAKQEASGVKTTERYSTALRSFALTLHYYSPKAYEYVRNTFHTCLPHPRTIKQWYQSINGEPGFTEESFVALKLKSQSATDHTIYAGLIMDEMAIRRRIEWDGKKFHGYVNIGKEFDGDYVTEAKEAFVFLVTAVNGTWKVPVGFFLVDGVTGSQRAELAKQCLERIHETGIKIVSLTFDGCASNISMMTHLGCSFEDTKFEHPVSKNPIMCILDPSHLIKLVRNAFRKYNTFVDIKGRHIKWSIIDQLNTLQVNEKFHLANKLTSRHIYFENQKMNVKFATQLFSESVANAIDFCRNQLKLSNFKDSEATSEFLRIMNNIFDIFNSRSLNVFGFKRAINESNHEEIFKYLDMAANYISSLKCNNETLLIKSPRKVGFLGLLRCVDAIKHFYCSLIVTKQLIYFPFYKVSQDHLELLFGNIRSHGGANNNPTARQFVAAYKKLLVHIELKNFDKGNCTSLEQLSILNCSSAVTRINMTTPGYSHAQVDNAEVSDGYADQVNIFYENLSEYSEQIICYIAGSLVRDLRKRIFCSVCVEALMTDKKKYWHRFIVMKDKGGLFYPSDDVIKVCKTSEAVLRTYTDKKRALTIIEVISKILKNFVGSSLFDNINYHQIGEYPSSNHITDLIKAVAEKYVNLRLHYLMKTSEKISKRQLLNKYILFQGQ